jgi:osmotically-inducible protein OsmY
MNLKLLLAALVLAATAATAGCAFLAVGAAAGAATAIATDRRMTDVMATDERIENSASSQLAKRFGDGPHFNVTSFNKQVLLTGEVPNEQMKADAEMLVLKIPDVRSVYNELVVGPSSSFANRSNDSYITSEVKARMTASGKFNPLYVKVVTEANTVFLMGLVTRQEGEDATNAARTANGVRRVVRLFEYVTLPPPSDKPAQQPPANTQRPQ